MSAPTWEELTALGITEAMDGGTVSINGEDWDADAEDSEGESLPPGQLYLTAGGAGRSVLVHVTVAIVEGALT